MQVSKELDKKCGLYCVNKKKLTKILKGHFHFPKIFDGFSSFSIGLINNDTNILCMFQKNRLKTVEFIA